MRCAHVTMNRDARPHYDSQPRADFIMGSTKGTILPCMSTISCSPLAPQVSMRTPLASAKSWEPPSSTAESIPASAPAIASCRCPARVTSRLWRSSITQPQKKRSSDRQCVHAKSRAAAGWGGPSPSTISLLMRSALSASRCPVSVLSPTVVTLNGVKSGLRA